MRTILNTDDRDALVNEAVRIAVDNEIGVELSAADYLARQREFNMLNLLLTPAEKVTVLDLTNHRVKQACESAVFGQAPIESVL